MDVDLMDHNRRNPTALTSFKMPSSPFTDIEKELYIKLGEKANLGLLQIRPNIDEHNPMKSSLEINGKNTNIEGWKESLRKLRNP